MDLGIAQTEKPNDKCDQPKCCFRSQSHGSKLGK